MRATTGWVFVGDGVVSTGVDGSGEGDLLPSFVDVAVFGCVVCRNEGFSLFLVVFEMLDESESGLGARVSVGVDDVTGEEDEEDEDDVKDEGGGCSPMCALFHVASSCGSTLLLCAGGGGAKSLGGEDGAGDFGDPAGGDVVWHSLEIVGFYFPSSYDLGGDLLIEDKAMVLLGAFTLALWIWWLLIFMLGDFLTLSFLAFGRPIGEC
ncbi:hypothetical protein SUGI_0183100 [Cryptomeria japonica]|nr:hypothetical protein SUGI_0183100 [Cryptomeria japonica]